MFKHPGIASVAIFLVLTPAAAQQASEILDNDAIVKMVQAKVPTDLIVQTIEQAKEVQFRLFPFDLISLKSAGVPDEVIRAMTAKAAGRPGPIPPPAPSPPAVSAGTRPSPPSQEVTPAAPPPDIPYLRSGMNEVLLNGMVAIPHADVGGTTATIRVGYGRYLADWFAIGPLISADFAGGDYHNITAAGVVQFVPRMTDRFYLVAGVGVGVNNIKVFESDTDLAAVAYSGPRVFLARHVALDIQYSLGYRHVEGLGFKDSSASGLAVGFSVIF